LTIESAIFRALRFRLGYKSVVPEVQYQGWVADFIAHKPGTILEVEIKRSWEDYRADFRKAQLRFSGPLPHIKKHSWLQGDYPCAWRPSHFAFAAHKELAIKIAEDPDLPPAYGVMSLVWVDNRSDLKAAWYYQKMLKPTRRLLKLRPEQEGRCKKALCRRAHNMIINYYKD